MSSPDIAWAAGFFDGEGSVGIYNLKAGRSGNRIFRLVLSISNTDPRTIRKLQNIFGGGYTRINRSHAVRLGLKPMYVWRLTGRKAASVLESLLPYLVCKREQAEIAIEFSRMASERTRGRGGYTANEMDERKKMYQSIAELKKVVF